MIRNSLVYFALILGLQSLIAAFNLKPAVPFQRISALYPSTIVNCLKEKRTGGRNVDSFLLNTFNEISEETSSSYIVDAPPTAQSATNTPLEQGKYRQGRIYKSYQDLVSYLMKTPLWREYSLSLTMKPVVTKAFSSTIGYFLGDILAQLIFRKVQIFL